MFITVLIVNHKEIKVYHKEIKVYHRKVTCISQRLSLYVYYSPEMVEGHPYGEKADIWALGCILYQMCVLDPPFYNTNMLTLVKSVSSTSQCLDSFGKAYNFSKLY